MSSNLENLKKHKNVMVFFCWHKIDILFSELLAKSRLEIGSLSHTRNPRAVVDEWLVYIEEGWRSYMVEKRWSTC
jgi:hypothetical protein